MLQQVSHLRDMSKDQTSLPFMKRMLLHRNCTTFLFLILFVIDIAIRMYALYFQDNLSNDSIDYLEFNKDYSDSKNLQTILFEQNIISHPPLIYMMMYTLNHMGVKDVELGMRIIIFLFGVFLPVILFAIVCVYTNNREIALYTLAVSAVHPFFVRMSCEILRDPLFMFFSSLFILELCLIKEPGTLKRIGHSVLCGLFLSLSCLSRFESIDLIFLAPVTMYLLLSKFDGDALISKDTKSRYRLYSSLFVIIIISSIIFQIVLNSFFGLSFYYYYSIFDYRFNNISS